MRTKQLQILAIALSSFVLPFTFSIPASAHVLKENNGVSAVLHIPPDDNPVAGKPLPFDFSFSSQTGTLNLEHCNCQVSVQTNGKTIQSTTIEPNAQNASEGVAVINFPSVGIYDVIIDAASHEGEFPPFHLDYVERVASSTTGSRTAPNNTIQLAVSLTGFILLLMIAYAMIERGGRYKPKSKI